MDQNYFDCKTVMQQLKYSEQITIVTITSNSHQTVLALFSFFFVYLFFERGSFQKMMQQTPWTQDVKLTYIRRLEDVLNVLIRSIYVLRPVGGVAPKQTMHSSVPLYLQHRKSKFPLICSIPLVFFCTPLKTSEDIWFQGVQKKASGMKLVNLLANKLVALFRRLPEIDRFFLQVLFG